MDGSEVALLGAAVVVMVMGRSLLRFAGEHGRGLFGQTLALAAGLVALAGGAVMALHAVLG